MEKQTNSKTPTYYTEDISGYWNDPLKLEEWLSSHLDGNDELIDDSDETSLFA